ncbi:MAG: archaemetzincin family Zn-dependent metalloprotease [Hadesarchaea archaeon]|nr:archaemetzincin family Zn-dependent metalloprotease [Hadesarchaea archaeon]
MNVIIIGKIKDTFVQELKSRVIETFDSLISDWGIIAKLKPAKSAYDSERNQYNASDLLKFAKNEMKNHERKKFLILTDVDLYSSELNFVFGQADCPGSFAIVSLHRLNPIFYDQNNDEELFLLRATKEVVHEIGHTFGLGHCTDPKCVMSFSNSILAVDQKKKLLCGDCREKLGI